MGSEAKAAMPPLLDILKDKNQPELVRCSAAQNLGRFGEHSKAALPVFSELLRDPKLPDRLATAVIQGLAAMRQRWRAGAGRGCENEAAQHFCPL